jgi:hypothetical protein
LDVNSEETIWRAGPEWFVEAWDLGRADEEGAA